MNNACPCIISTPILDCTLKKKMLCSTVVRLKRKGLFQVDRNCYFFIGSAFNFGIKSKWLCMDKFRVFVEMLMRDASLKQTIPCIIRISIFGLFSAWKKCALYMGKYSTQSFFHFKGRMPNDRRSKWLHRGSNLNLLKKRQYILGAATARN